MLKKWRLSNFKAIQGDLELELRGLTVLAGANSSGKSTIMQSILLVRQSLLNTAISGAMSLNGGLVRLGAFSEIVNCFCPEQAVGIGWELDERGLTPRITAPELLFDPHLYYYSLPGRRRNVSELTCRIEFGNRGSENEPELAQYQPHVRACSLSTLTRDDQRTGQRSSVRIHASESTSHARLSALGISGDEPPRRGGLVPSLAYEVDDLTLPPASRRRLTLGLSSRRFMPEAAYDVEDGEGPVEELEVAGCVVRGILPEGITARVNTRWEEARLISLLLFSTSKFGRSKSERAKLLLPSTAAQAVVRALGNDAAGWLPEDAEWTSLFKRPSRSEFSVLQWEIWLAALKKEQRKDARDRIRLNSGQISAAIVRDQAPMFGLAAVPVLEFREAGLSVRRFFEHMVRYLGPLRDEPRPVYPLDAVPSSSDVGLRGEHTSAVLHLNRNRDIRWIAPGHFESGEVGRRPVDEMVEQASLHDAVVDWLRYLGVARDVQTRDRGILGYELKVETEAGRGLRDLTHVGVGVSQVLPIVVSALLAPEGALLMFEQPELHLHPKVQARLADLFLALALQGKQCLVETHSEYLVNRLRLRIASSGGEALQQFIGTYFVENVAETARFRLVSINRYGAVEDWPAEFFDQTQRETEGILAAAARKFEEDVGDARYRA